VTDRSSSRRLSAGVKPGRPSEAEARDRLNAYLEGDEG
jgi:hypothetical protein